MGILLVLSLFCTNVDPAFIKQLDTQEARLVIGTGGAGVSMLTINAGGHITLNSGGSLLINS